MFLSILKTFCIHTWPVSKTTVENKSFEPAVSNPPTFRTCYSFRTEHFGFLPVTCLLGQCEVQKRNLPLGPATVSIHNQPEPRIHVEAFDSAPVQQAATHLQYGGKYKPNIPFLLYLPVFLSVRSTFFLPVQPVHMLHHVHVIDTDEQKTLKTED